MEALAAEIIERKALDLILDSAEYEDVPLEETEADRPMATVEAAGRAGRDGRADHAAAGAEPRRGRSGRQRPRRLQLANLPISGRFAMPTGVRQSVADSARHIVPRTRRKRSPRARTQHGNGHHVRTERRACPCEPAGPALPRLRPAAADDAGRPAAGEPHRLPGQLAGDRRQPGHHRLPGQHHHPEAAVPAVREPEPGNPLLHQLPGRLGDGHAGHLRHDAVPGMPDRDLLHGPGGQRRAPSSWPAAPRASASPCRTPRS